MYKNYDSDVRNKPNLELSPKYRNFNQEDKVLTTGLRSVAQEEIRDLFKKDAKSHLPALQLHKSRDVSHLKDLNSVRSYTSLVNLPTDIQTLRLFIDSKSKKNIEKAKVCKKKNCVERVVSLSPDIEGLEMNEQGIPTGRKEAENLLKWFRAMKVKHGDVEEFDVVVLISGQEVLKQVKGQCKHLGIVLKFILRYYRNSIEKNRKRLQQETEIMKLSYEAKISKLLKNHQEELQKFENKSKEYQNLIEKHKTVIKNFQEDTSFYKSKLNEVQRLYLTEQDIWRKKSLDLIRESVRRPTIISHESYKLAVARWRKDLFKEEIESQPRIQVPELIREKLENEQPLTAEELSIYRDLYYKAEDDKYKIQTSEKETQTETRDSRNSIEKEKSLDDSLHLIGLNIEKTEKILEAVYDDNLICTEDKEVQTNIENEYLVDDDVLKDLEKFLTYDENFEFLMMGEKQVDGQSLNTSYNSSKEQDSDVQDKNGVKSIVVGWNQNEENKDLIESQLEEMKSEGYEKGLGITPFLHNQEELLNDDVNDLKPTEPQANILKLIQSTESQSRNKSKTERPYNKKLTKKSPSLKQSVKDLNKSSDNHLALAKKKNKPNQSVQKPRIESTKTPSGLTDLKIPNNRSSTTLKPRKMSNLPTSGFSGTALSPEPKSLIVLTKAKTKTLEPEDSKETFSVLQPLKIDSLAKSITPEPEVYHKTESDLKALISQTSLSSNKPETELSQFSNDRQENLRFNQIKRRQTELIQSLISGKLGPALQKSAQSLTKNIQDKIKELNIINNEIAIKQKILLALSNHIQSQEILKKSRKRVASARVSIKNNSLIESENLNYNKFNEKIEDFDTIDEVSEDFENLTSPPGLDSETWKNGYVLGYSDGKVVGFRRGKEFGNEEIYLQGYAQAAREIMEEESQEQEFKKSQSSEISSPINRVMKKSKMAEVKSNKELTRFNEFNFNNKKLSPKRVNPLIYENVFTLMRKIPEFLKRKSKISRKMMFKMMTGFYEAAFYQMSTEEIKDMILVCHDEIAHRYGLKKVSDRKFLEFIAEVIKNKDLKRCSMFLKLINSNSLLNTDNYSRHTLSLYLESYKFMLNSKIGIMTNVDETDDKILIPVNRAIECIRDKLEGKIEKHQISSLISTIEHKSSPDPRRINTALVELEAVLELICESYESTQSKIKNSVKKIFNLFMQNEMISNYVVLIVIRTISPYKYSKFEETIGKLDVCLDDICDICINLNIFIENDFINCVKGYSQKLFESYEELKQILGVMREREGEWYSFSVEEWENLLRSCIDLGDGDDLACVLWQVYENELKRISLEINSI